MVNNINVFFDFGGAGRYHYAALRRGGRFFEQTHREFHGMGAAKTLDALRREIDRIDNQIHDLIQERTRIVERVREVKEGEPVKIRPAREDEILYRLVARHSGNFPKRELTRIWRELIVATLSFEGPFSVSVFGDEAESGYRDLARDMYGTYTPTTVYPSARRVIEAVRKRTATVGVLPLPRRDDEAPWWPLLMGRGRTVPKVMARLPVAGPGNGRGQHLEALAICPVDREPTGRDRSLIAFETEDEPGLRKISAALNKTGLSSKFATVWQEPESGGGHSCYLIELEGYVLENDPSVTRFIEALGASVNRVVCLGHYGIPFGPEELAPSPEKKRKPRRTAGGKPQDSKKKDPS